MILYEIGDRVRFIGSRDIRMRRLIGETGVVTGETNRNGIFQGLHIKWDYQDKTKDYDWKYDNTMFESVDMSPIHTGDIVKVLFVRNAYPTQTLWVEKHAPECLGFFAYGSKPTVNDIYMVVANSAGTCLIQADGYGSDPEGACFLIAEDNLELLGRSDD